MVLSPYPSHALLPLDAYRALVLSECIATRFSHDITGPVGALNNGVEFLTSEDDDMMREQALELVANSAREAVHKVQFYRLCYGAVRGEAADQERILREASAQYFHGGRVVLNWPAEASLQGLSRKVSKLVGLMLLVGSEVLIRGGNLSLVRVGGGRGLAVSASGPTIKWEPEQAALLSLHSPVDLITPKLAPVHLAALIAAESGMELRVEAAADRLSLIAVESAHG